MCKIKQNKFKNYYEKNKEYRNAYTKLKYRLLKSKIAYNKYDERIKLTKDEFNIEVSKLKLMYGIGSRGVKEVNNSK